MVKFRQRLDRNQKIYIPKPLREAGFNHSLEIIPNYKAAIMYPTGTNLRDVEKSLQTLLRDVEHRILSRETTSNVG